MDAQNKRKCLTKLIVCHLSHHVTEVDASSYSAPWYYLARSELDPATHPSTPLHPSFLYNTSTIKIDTMAKARCRAFHAILLG